MRLTDCINKAVEGGYMRRKQAEQLRELLKLQNEPDDHRFLEIFIQATQEQRRLAQLQAIATKRNLGAVNAHPNGPGRGVLALLVRDIADKAPYSNIDYRRLSILGELHGHFADAMSAYRTRNLGFSQNLTGIKNMVKELFGEASGDVDAAHFAKLWSETADMARLRFNVAGGNIPKRKDWGLPHVHDAKKIADVAFEEWRDFIVPRLDRNRMYDSMGNRMSDTTFNRFIQELYAQFSRQALETATDIDRTVPKGVDHRLLTFKNSSGWMEYNQRFGHPDIYHTMNTHLEHMAGDTALMEILGPHPDQAMRQLRKIAADAGTPALRMKLIKDAYDVVTGRVNQTESDFLAGLGTTVRNLLSAAQLGSAFISSFGDLWTARMTASLNGLSTVKFLSRMFSLAKPGNEADRIFAVKLGLGAEAWISRAIAGNRYGEITGNGLSARISDVTMRAGLLAPWTAAGKWAFGMELSAFVAEQSGKTYKKLPELLRNAFQRYGIDEAHWNVIRKAPLIERDGAKFIRPRDIFDQSKAQVKDIAGVFRSAAEDVTAEENLRGNRPAALGARMEEHGAKARASVGKIDLNREAANKLEEMFLTEMRMAFVEPDARIRAIMTQGQRRGSLMGEILRSAALFKSFPASMISTHLWRGAYSLDGLSRARYLSELLIGLTVFGAASVQARNLIKGKDVQDMSGPDFWAQAFMQSGGLGLAGDFIFSEANRFSKGPIMTAAGPVADLVDDTAKLTLGNLSDFIKGKNTKLAADLLRFGNKYTPGGNIWYTRLALQRLLWDQLQQAADPEAHQSFRRIMQAARKDFGTEYWWKPGESAPERGPDVGRALGE